MQARAWRGGSTENPSYGLTITKSDRDRSIDRSIGSAWLELPTEARVIQVNLTDAFWRDCSEFRHPAIRDWFEELGVLDWPKGNPPRFALQPTGPNQLMARKLEHRSLL